MPKSRKTRKEKQLADQRTVTYSFAPKPDLQTKKPEIEHKVTASEATQTKQVPQNSSSIITSDYHYLSGDLLKTTFLTGSIVVIELIIKQFARI